MKIQYMQRKIIDWLEKWKESKDRKPLILQGARQVGKTYSSLMFGKEYYKTTAYFNFENNKDLASIFDRDLDSESILKRKILILCYLCKKILMIHI